MSSCFTVLHIGLSAPYCAGPVVATLAPECFNMRPLKTVPSRSVGLVGFNPAHLARNVTIKQLQTLCGDATTKLGELSTFRDLVLLLNDRCWNIAQGADNCNSLINPVIGPEPVTGSSRMKGGTATMIILDMLCLLTIGKSTSILHKEYRLRELATMDPCALLRMYQACHSEVYSSVQHSLPVVMEEAASSIRNGGRLLYLGIGSAGALGCIDASEMPDTYGAPFDQIRGFVHKGWTGLNAKDGDISHMSHLHRISLDNFNEDLVPTLARNDMILVLLSDPEHYQVDEVMALKGSVQTAIRAGATVRLVQASFVPVRQLAESNQHLQNFLDLFENATHKVVCRLNVSSAHRHIGFADFALKLITNAITTFAQAKGRGAIYKSLMISTGPANDKIYMRCVHMIAHNVRVTAEMAEQSLVRSIYGFNVLPDGFMQAKTREDHIRAGLLPHDQRHQAQSILPVAFLLASDERMSVAAAREAVRNEPCISVLLQKLFETPTAPATQRTSANVGPAPHAQQASAVGGTSDFVVGLDLGGTNIRGAAIRMSDGAYVSDIVRRTIHDRSVEGVGSLLGEVFDAVLASYDSRHDAAAGASPVAVGVGQPGCADENGCISKMANFAEWMKPLDVRAAIVGRPRSPGREYVFVGEDAGCALQAELLYGAARLSRSAVMLTIGTGLGSAVSIDGLTVFRGSRGLVEVGHSIVVANDSAAPLCSCGQRGCLELFCSASGIARMATELELEGDTSDPSFIQTCLQTIDDSVDARHSANAKRRQLAEKLVKFLGIGIVNVIRQFDPSVVLLAGGLAKPLYPFVMKQLKSLLWHLHDDLLQVPVVLASSNEPGVLGAGAMAITAFRQLNAQTSISCHAMSGKSVYLRHAVEGDRSALYTVCLRTGNAGADGTHLFSDPMLLGSIYVGPYLSHSQSFALALVKEGEGAVGYTLGVLDTLKFNELCEREWWPRLIQKYAPDKISQLWDNEKELIANEVYTHDNNNSNDVKLEDDPELVSFYKKYPSHMHIDMVAEMQGHGHGLIMVNTLLHYLRSAGSCGVHLCMHSSNNRAYHFYTTKLGFKFIKNKGNEEWILAREL
jgi:predicted NBD/HSP70 family sugar kinase/N-acetylmuramic acid 6-phosphate (MurNAc-6-P) etherase/ribosomal protein S18 acetylase RimI-like enzyme